MFSFQNQKSLGGTRSGCQRTSNLGFSRDRKASPVSECLRRDLDTGSRLLALVLRAVDHADHSPHQFGIETAVGGDALRRVQVLNVILEYGIENFVRWQTVAVFLVRAQFSRRRLLQARLRNHGAARVCVLTQTVNQCFWNVGDDGQSAHHVSIKCTVAHAQFALVAGGEHDGSEFVGKRHQQRTASARLNIFLGDIFVAAAEHTLQRLTIRLIDVVDGKQLKTDPKIPGQRPGIVDRALRRVRTRHTNADDILWTKRIRRNDGREGRVDPAAQADDGFLESALVHVVARPQYQRAIHTDIIACYLLVQVASESFGIEIDEILFEGSPLGDDLTFRVQHQAGAIKEQAVVSPDLIYHRDRHLVLAGDAGQHVAAKFTFSNPEGRSGDIQHKVAACADQAFDRIERV